MKRIVLAAACLIVVATMLQALFDYSRQRDRQLFGHLVHRIDTDRPVVALTLDDGPTRRFTAPLLDILDKAGVTATFFLTGREVTAFPEGAQAVVDAGHEVGNHSWNHRRMVAMTPWEVRRQLRETDAAIRALGYEGPLHFRPPYGRKLVVLPWVLARQDRTTIMWSVEPETDLAFDAPPQDLAAHVIETTQAGDIILLHGMYSGNDSSRAALPLIIAGLRARGFDFVTVSELIALEAAR